MSTTPNQTSGTLNQWQNNTQPPLPGSPAPKRRSHVRTLLAVLAFVAVAAVLLLNRSPIVDYVLANIVYTPESQTKTVASQLELTWRGREIFYASQPAFSDSSSAFPCKSGELNSVILGCYSTTSAFFGLGTIYVLDVKNAALEGVVQVTAAHEMLHAAYSRLNFLDRQSVDKMVLDEYDKIKDDPTVKEQMDYYKIAEPGQNLNELHSIIGTTVAAIDPDLERYYGQYFQDRAAIVDHYKTYFKALHKNDQQIAELSAKLKAESQSLEQDVTMYQTDLQQLNLDIDSFNQRANSGGFSSRSSFDATRAALVARVDDMNARAASLNARVQQYNADVQTINSLSAETQELYSSLKGVDAPTAV